MLLGSDFLKCFAEIFQAAPHGMTARLDKMCLLITFPKRKGTSHPPNGSQKKHKDHRRAERKYRDAHGRLIQYIDHHAKYEGKATADISPCIAAGRDFVHPLGNGDVAQHGIIYDQTEGVCRLCKYKKRQKPDPMPDKTEHGAAERPCKQNDGKDLLFHAAKIARRTQNRPDQRDDRRRYARGIA